MLFNSHPFIFLFFPAVLLSYEVAARMQPRLGLAVLLGASLVFYGWWDVRLLPLLLASIGCNFALGRALSAARIGDRPRRARLLLSFGVALNLGVLAGFKYVRFLVLNLDAAFDTTFDTGRILLPLGISFFTFEQIGFLVDIGAGAVRMPRLLDYSFFVAFFRRLVAGPILRFKEIGPQLCGPRRLAAGDLAVGLTMFFIGLAKKSLLADGIAPYVQPIFASAGQGEPIDLLLSWAGALAYTCQLYFDFSGYSDMAIGIARCFGIRFPMNFMSPYKATSIIDFWRRWHITLSRFLRDYLYIPLGGNRRGSRRRFTNLMVTMLLGGLWHGANWTFVAWGGLHGAYLVVNHAWQAAYRRFPALGVISAGRGGVAASWALTFVAVVVGWVFFRSPSFAAAGRMLAGMAGLHGVVVPAGLAFIFGPIRQALAGLGVVFGDGSGSQLLATWLWVIASLVIMLLLPSTQELLVESEPVLDMPRLRDLRGSSGFAWLRWHPSGAWAVAIGLLAFLGSISVTRLSEFLYWQF